MNKKDKKILKQIRDRGMTIAPGENSSLVCITYEQNRLHYPFFGNSSDDGYPGTSQEVLDTSKRIKKMSHFFDLVRGTADVYELNSEGKHQLNLFKNTPWYIWFLLIFSFANLVIALMKW